MKTDLRHLLLVLLALSIAGCGSRYRGRHGEQEHTLAVVALNDIHGNIDQFPRIAFMVDSLRAIYPDLLLISSGDVQTGNPINDNFDPKGLPMIELMNMLRFDVSAVGNHEFDLGQEGFALLSRRAHFPFLAANVFPAPQYRMQLRPYHQVTLRDGTRVTMIGLLALGELGIPESHPKNVVGVAFTDPIEEMGRYHYLINQSDLFLAVTHLGYDDDKRLAQAYPDIDLILGGHSHTLIETPGEELHNGVMIVQSGYKAGHMTLVLLEHHGGRVVSRRARLLTIDARHGEVDKEVQAMVDSYNADPHFTRVIATNPLPITDKQTLGAIFTDAQRWYSRADFAMQNPGGIRIGSLPAGAVTLKDILRMDPFGNEQVVLTMTGRQLTDFFLHAWTTDGNRPAHVSGLRVVYRLDDTGVLMECIVYPSGSTSPVEPDKLYTLATSSYVQAAYRYQTSAADKNQGVTTAEAVVHYLEQYSEIPPAEHENRVSVEVVRR